MTFQQNKNKNKSFCFKCLITFFLNECLRSLTYLVIALVHNNSNFFSNANDSLSLKFYERVCCRQFILLIQCIVHKKHILLVAHRMGLIYYPCFIKNKEILKIEQKLEKFKFHRYNIHVQFPAIFCYFLA